MEFNIKAKGQPEEDNTKPKAKTFQEYEENEKRERDEHFYEYINKLGKPDYGLVKSVETINEMIKERNENKRQQKIKEEKAKANADIDKRYSTNTPEEEARKELLKGLFPDEQ